MLKSGSILYKEKSKKVEIAPRINVARAFRRRYYYLPKALLVNFDSVFYFEIENKEGAGLTFYCSTQSGEEHRFVIGNVKSFASHVERDAPSAYNGPEFEDLDDKLQQAFDE